MKTKPDNDDPHAGEIGILRRELASSQKQFAELERELHQARADLAKAQAALQKRDSGKPR